MTPIAPTAVDAAGTAPPADGPPLVELRRPARRLRRASRCCTASTSSCRLARSPPCSGRTAPARRPRCARWPGLHPATGGDILLAGRRGQRRPAPTTSPGPGCASSPRGGASSRTSPSRENLRVATHGGRSARGGRGATPTTASRDSSERRQQVAGTLSGGEQQMLALARAVASRPGVLLLDELSMGLAPLVVASLYEEVARIAAERGRHPGGRAVRPGRRCEVADHAAVLAAGTGGGERDTGGTGRIVDGALPGEWDVTDMQTEPSTEVDRAEGFREAVAAMPVRGGTVARERALRRAGRRPARGRAGGRRSSPTSCPTAPPTRCSSATPSCSA